MSASEISIRTLLERCREIAVVCSRDGEITWRDERARELLGLQPTLPLTSWVDPQSLAAARELFARAGRSAPACAELTLLTRHGSQRFEATAHLDGEAVLLVATRASGREAASDVGALERQLREMEERIALLNRELNESNRGVVALYAELDEKADSLRRASELKSRVVSNVSHEFRTPLNSILGLTRLLLSRIDGPLTPEQEKQLSFILRSATELSELVTDLLDLSRIEAGKIRLQTNRFEVGELFAALRGVSRPLQLREEVQLIFEEPPDLPKMETDDAKISQVLRNLVSNALKFTERGEVRVSASSPDGRLVSFTVTDTGLGISPEDQERIFEEFVQLENRLQQYVKGTGLGLSLSRKLADLLGGTLSVTSEPGKGSRFTLTIPAVHPDVSELQQLSTRPYDPSRAPVLVLEDDRKTLFLYEKYLEGSGFQVMPARSVDEARALIEHTRPAAVVLDIMLEGETSWNFLAELKGKPTTRDIPILVVTITDRENKARALGADEFWMKPMDQQWLLRKLKQLARSGPVERVLIIDDDEVSRYLVKRLLSETSYRMIEATGGQQGVEIARRESPDVILLDFVMPGMSAFEVLDELKADARTRRIPVIVHTSKDLGEEERKRLAAETAAILNKQSLSREVAIARIREALVKAGVGAGRGDSSG